MTKLYDEGGYTITLTQHKQFKVDGPEVAGDNFDTYAKAVEKVEKAVGAAAKRSKRGLSLEAYSDDGTPVVITGLHATRGVILAKPKTEGTRGGYRNEPDFYPRVPVVLDLLKEEGRLERALKAVRDKLLSVEIEEIGWNIKNRDYDQALDTLTERHAQATAKAEAMAISKAEIEAAE